MFVMVLCAAAITSAILGGDRIVIWFVLALAAGMAISREARERRRDEDA